VSPRPVLTLIAAVSADGFISTGKGVPWHLPRDIAHFRSTTSDQWLLIGRSTYLEMLGWFKNHRPLVLTRDPAFIPPIGQAVSSVAEALQVAEEGGAADLFVCGGGGAYNAAMPWADRLILTHVDCALGSGVPFPAMNPGEWQMTTRQDFSADADHAHGHQIATYQRLIPATKPSADRL
jgi:dihydrofolate reductase